MDNKNDLKLRKLQLCQLHILEDVDQICKDNGLTYFLVGGTALGAVRHGGFIPWDDDLDIAMYRNDYEALQKIIVEQYSDKYFLQSPETDKNYPRVIAKIRLNGTVEQERSFENVDCNNGIYIDVFPIDYVKKSGGFGMWFRGKIIRFCFAYKTIQAGSNNGHHMRLKSSLRFITKIIPPLCVDHIIKYVCVMDNKKRRNYSTIFLSGYGWKKQMHKSETFGDGRRILFEGKEFNAPADVNAFLKQLFGDYMTLPPVEKRVAHKLTYIDFGPYDTALEKEVVDKLKEDNLHDIRY